MLTSSVLCTRSLRVNVPISIFNHDHGVSSHTATVYGTLGAYNYHKYVLLCEILPYLRISAYMIQICIDTVTGHYIYAGSSIRLDCEAFVVVTADNYEYNIFQPKKFRFKAGNMIEWTFSCWVYYFRKLPTYLYISSGMYHLEFLKDV